MSLCAAASSVLGSSAATDAFCLHGLAPFVNHFRLSFVGFCGWSQLRLAFFQPRISIPFNATYLRGPSKIIMPAKRNNSERHMRSVSTTVEHRSTARLDGGGHSSKHHRNAIRRLNAFITKVAAVVRCAATEPTNSGRTKEYGSLAIGLLPVCLSAIRKRC